MNNTIDELLLLSGNDIPFPEAQLTIHQPTIKEIAYVGEENFFTGCQLLNFSKNLLSEEDKVHLENQSNFDILIAILKERNAVMQKNRNCVFMVLALLFPIYTINLKSDCIVFGNEDGEYKIDNNNFEVFKSILNSIFQLKKDSIEDLNPKGDMAKKIAEKLKKRHQKLAASKKDEKSESVLSRYISILAVGESKDMNSLFNYTFYQLLDELERYQLKIGYDMYIQAKMAGAKDLKEVDDWMKNIHSEEEKDK